MKNKILVERYLFGRVKASYIKGESGDDWILEDGSKVPKNDSLMVDIGDCDLGFVDKHMRDLASIADIHELRKDAQELELSPYQSQALAAYSRKIIEVVNGDAAKDVPEINPALSRKMLELSADIIRILKSKQDDYEQ